MTGTRDREKGEALQNRIKWGCRPFWIEIPDIWINGLMITEEQHGTSPSPIAPLKQKPSPATGAAQRAGRAEASSRQRTTRLVPRPIL